MGLTILLCKRPQMARVSRLYLLSPSSILQIREGGSGGGGWLATGSCKQHQNVGACVDYFKFNRQYYLTRVISARSCVTLIMQYQYSMLVTWYHLTDAEDNAVWSPWTRCTDAVTLGYTSLFPVPVAWQAHRWVQFSSPVGAVLDRVV